MSDSLQDAHSWRAFADKIYGTKYPNRSLCLITGVCKASSWSLGSFNHVRDTTGEIFAKEDNKNPGVYTLRSSFHGDWRCCSMREVSGAVNQTVFIVGFRITFSSWLPDPIVKNITEPDSIWSILVYLIMACLRRLRDSSRGRKQPATISMEDRPQLSQPAHPSDIINHALLRENPVAHAAIPHDDQWMDMTKEGMDHENPHEELPSPGSPTPQSEILLPTTPEFMSSLPPTPSLDDPLIVITHIRAENICCGGQQIPAGFYVLVEFGDVQQRTQNKSTQLNVGCIEWEDEVSLPSETFDMARFTVYASFELDPILGNGEALYTAEVHAKELVGGTHLIMLSSGESETVSHEPSLLITLGKWYSDYPAVTSSGSDNNLELEESSDLTREIIGSTSTSSLPR